MLVINKINPLKAKIGALKRKGLTIGFVPTMGALHEGHLSLMRRAGRETDIVVVSIFVNPMQFGPKEDYKRYPRPVQQDLHLCRSAGVDIVFSPSDKEIYPFTARPFRTSPQASDTLTRTFVDMYKLTETMCGKSRPGHFRGVLTVVNKLFNIVEPDIAYFGQKDYQQALVIKQMVTDLNMDVQVKVMPIVREKDGLAMSSRNKYLTPAERQEAICLYRALLKATELICSSRRPVSAVKIIGAMKGIINSVRHSRIDYIAVVDPQTLEPIKTITYRQVLIALAVYIGKTRLIDNFLICK
ncbi:MAG: pantoate--beta-alanine ligase [Planctomycetes bacterium]|nr:pantoate--beta-alanine ligase [Planctomycetota bacterium]